MHCCARKYKREHEGGNEATYFKTSLQNENPDKHFSMPHSTNYVNWGVLMFFSLNLCKFQLEITLIFRLISRGCISIKLLCCIS